jgi:SAM-dependent methyltransferase
MKSKTITYKDDPISYNLLENIPGEKAMLVAGASMIENYLLHHPGKISVIDFCCGTELIFEHLNVTVLKRVEKFVGIDISAEFLADAGKRVGKDPRFIFVQHDAATYSDDKKFNIVFASSAYHHIENKRKLKFLNTIHKHLADNGIVIFLENIIPSFHTEEERMVSAVEFYARRIIDCIDNHKIRDMRIPLLSRVMQYERDGEYEMKSHYNLFKQHLNRAHLQVIKEIKVWPKKKLFKDDYVGDFAFLVKKF